MLINSLQLLVYFPLFSHSSNSVKNLNSPFSGFDHYKHMVREINMEI
jgi:hypothetical protein